MRARPPPADARPLKDGKAPENAFSAARAKAADTMRASKDAIKRWETITGPNAWWNYLHFDDRGIKRVWGPIPRWQLELYCMNGTMSEYTLVQPASVGVSRPFVTIRKMVACEWEYPGPAEGA